MAVQEQTDGFEPNKQTPPASVDLGATANKFSNVHSTSGVFDGIKSDNGITVVAPKGSGWIIQVDNAGTVAAGGPIDLS